MSTLNNFVFGKDNNYNHYVIKMVKDREYLQLIHLHYITGD